MKILFDQGTPAPLRRLLNQHEISTAFELGWSQLKNGELLDAAEKSAFELLITTDANLRYQQNLTTRRIAANSDSNFRRCDRCSTIITRLL